MADSFLKDDGAVLDYVFNWASWLQSGETISIHTITEETGITVDSDSESSGVVTVWLSGGTVGTDYTVACEIVTSLGRTDERSMTIRCVER